jgi:hypothetical protein
MGISLARERSGWHPNHIGNIEITWRHFLPSARAPMATPEGGRAPKKATGHVLCLKFYHPVKMGIKTTNPETNPGSF